MMKCIRSIQIINTGKPMGGFMQNDLGVPMGGLMQDNLGVFLNRQDLVQMIVKGMIHGY